MILAGGCIGHLLVSLLLLTSCRMQQFRARLAPRQGVIRCKRSPGCLPGCLSCRDPLPDQGQYLALLGDGGIELIKKFMVISPIRRRQPALHRSLKARAILIVILKQQDKFGFYIQVLTVQRTQALGRIVGSGLGQFDQRF